MINSTRTFAHRIAVIGVIVALLLTASSLTHAANSVGKVLAARGVVSAQDERGAQRLVGRETPISTGDVLSTGKRSFAILEFSDGTRMSLRPETVFKVEQWSTEPQQERAITRLFKGGMRAITGFITKRNSRAFQVNTPVATIGIRGTTFDARLCTDDCLADAEAAGTGPTAITSKAVGRVAFVRGDARARVKGSDASRAVESGSPLYEGDLLTTGTKSFAVLIFNDRSRVTLRPETVFRIDQLQYSADDPQNDSAVFNLVRGGLRAISGLIGKRNSNRVRYRTAIATIGIRGTGFDLICVDACDGQGNEQSFDLRELIIPDVQAAVSLPTGVLARSWLNDIYAEVNGQRFDIPQGKVVFIPLSSLIPQELPQMPFEIEEPRPDQIEIDESDLFEYSEGRDGAPGLHVACIEGTACAVGGEILAAGETLYQSDDGTVVVKTPYAAGFLVNDKYFKTINIAPDVLDLLYDLNSPAAAGECSVGS